jgi:hypothetical protein
MGVRLSVAPKMVTLCSMLKNNDKGMPYLDLRDFEAETVLSFVPEAALSFVQTV